MHLNGFDRIPRRQGEGAPYPVVGTADVGARCD